MLTLFDTHVQHSRTPLSLPLCHNQINNSKKLQLWQHLFLSEFLQL